ncbi:Hsp70 family protein [Chachezhania antarctica]|uniref:Hsp70 family protein n=1 Tax=Chachezhania antarctica TaxID=2340860 RepID=UPI000EB4DE9E|nr:Hsp70 family protein [Chachezhania antarctica]
MSTDTLAIDFGTSNSAAAVLDNGRPRRLRVETGAETLPTAVFFPEGGGPMLIGSAAARALVAGEEGRYMRALKSVLGTSLFHEERLISGKRRTLADVVSAFLAQVKQRSEQETGRQFTRALSGRPVHFHTADPDRDARAEADLRACYDAAGFDTVEFMFEPEAAALASHGANAAGGTGLIVDIGGGTSDFSVFTAEDGAVRILASHGIRLGGTDFDHAVSMAHAMPHLGHGGALRREMGPGLLPTPAAIYVDLATWAKIPFLYTPETRREVARMVKLAEKPGVLGRLSTVLEEELGHDLAFAVERGKIAANQGADDVRIAMGLIEKGLSAGITPRTLDDCLADFAAPLRDAATETLDRAGVDRIDTIVLVGGSSLMSLIEREMREVCPGAAVARTEAFTAVADGLALATGA